MARVSIDDVRAARDLLAHVLAPSPMEESRWLAALVGGPAWFKCENLQRAGSFKVRGAYTRMAGLSDAERALGVVTASAGNHAQGVAVAASLLGIAATVFMPAGSPLPKENATRGYGASSSALTSPPSSSRSVAAGSRPDWRWPCARGVGSTAGSG